MAHIVVGERLAGTPPEVLGHVIRGAGHFIEQGNGVVQEFARHIPEIPMNIVRALPDLTDPATYERWQWNTLTANYGEGSLLAGSNHESSAAERALRESIDRSFENIVDVTKDLGLAIGSAMAGDNESAIGYGAAAVEKFVGGALKDMGFNGGWGPTPGQGTCPPGPHGN